MPSSVLDAIRAGHPRPSFDLHSAGRAARPAAHLRAERTLGRLAADAETDAAAAMIVGICHETVLSGLLPSVKPATPPSAESVISAVLRGIGK